LRIRLDRLPPSAAKILRPHVPVEKGD
jgi:hypothetical protein